jgi:hypothetical protein
MTKTYTLHYSINDTRGFIVDKKLVFANLRDAMNFVQQLRSRSILVGKPLYEVK